MLAATNAADTRNVKISVCVAWAAGSFVAYQCFKGVFARIRLGKPGAANHEDLSASGRVVSLCHALVVTFTSLATVLTSSPLDFTDANGLEPTLGSIGLCVSVAYFSYDLWVVIETQHQPVKPMIAHHLLSGSCMLLIAFAVPRAVWYACLLQATEATAPINIGIYFLEWGQKKASLVYRAARWLQLAVWLVMRELLFVWFAYLVWRDWTSMPSVMKALGWGTGAPLALFNTVGLFKVVLKGCPWSPEKRPEKQS